MASDGDYNASIPPPFQTVTLGRCRGIDVSEMTVSELQLHLQGKDFTSADLVGCCLDRIHSTNQYLEAVTEVNPDAQDDAEVLDLRRQLQSKPLDGVRSEGGRLYGIPVLVKDNMATADRMQTTAGSWALLGSKVPRDAHVVSLIRKSEAIILGHSSMEEWAGIRSVSCSTGYSARGGQTRNPYNLRKEPSGSSGGSAVAVSAGLVPLAFGTDTDSSIIWPAMKCGVVGIKPTVGLTSRSGVIPISKNMDSVGPIARTVADAVFGLDAIVGEDPRDPFTTAKGRRQEPNYATFLSTRDALKGARFGLPMKRCWDVVRPDCKAVTRKVLDTMIAAGAEVVEVDLPSIEERANPAGEWNWRHGEPSKAEITVGDVDAYNGLNAYFSELRNTPIRTVEDVIEYNRQNGGTEGGLPGKHPAFASGQDALEQVAATKGMENEIYHAALAHIHTQTRENGIDAALQYQSSGGDVMQLDALLMCDRKGIGMQYAAQAGYPVIVIPIGLDDDGMPVGLSLFGTAWGEGALIRWASAIEDLWKGIEGPRRRPLYRNHLSKNIPIEAIP